MTPISEKISCFEAIYRFCLQCRIVSNARNEQKQTLSWRWRRYFRLKREDFLELHLTTTRMLHAPIEWCPKSLNILTSYLSRDQNISPSQSFAFWGLLIWKFMTWSKTMHIHVIRCKYGVYMQASATESMEDGKWNITAEIWKHFKISGFRIT